MALTYALEFKDVSKSYNENIAVDSISFTVNKGEFFSLLGPSGCGKTTTLRLVAGLEEPTSGDIFIDGKKESSAFGKSHKQAETNAARVLIEKYKTTGKF